MPLKSGRKPGVWTRHVLDQLADKFTVGDGCWEWTAYVHPNGYGRFNHWQDGKNVTKAAHRAVYEVMVGPVPEGLDLDHLCRNRRCVRPDHLEPVTRSTNMLRGIRSTSRLRGPVRAVRHRSGTHCPHGHLFDEQNTYWRRDGKGRDCLTCRRAASARSRQKKRGE